MSLSLSIREINGLGMSRPLPDVTIAKEVFVAVDE